MTAAARQALEKAGVMVVGADAFVIEVDRRSLATVLCRWLPEEHRQKVTDIIARSSAGSSMSLPRSYAHDPMDVAAYALPASMGNLLPDSWDMHPGEWLLKGV